MKNFTLLILFLLSMVACVIAQPTVDFEAGGAGAAYAWSVFENDTNPALEIVDNPLKTGINNSAKVAKFTAKSGGQPYAGTQTAHGDFGTFTLSASNSKVKIMVYKTYISDVGLQFSISSDGAQPALKVANTKIDQWEELTFDFSAYIGTQQTINIDRIIVFPDWTARTSERVAYFDNLTFSAQTTGGGGGGSDPTTAATPPTRAAANVLSLYSNSYTNIDGVNLNPGWGQATVESEVQLSGNSTLKLANLNYQGVELANTQNVSSYTGVHIDYWTSTSTDFNFYLISVNPTVDTKKYSFAITKGAWQSVDIPLTTYAGVDLTKLAQMKFDGNGTIYLDNIYFYKETTPTLPTLPLDFESTTIPYTFTDFGGGVMSVIANPNSGGINTSAKVAKMVKNAPEVYGGSFISLAAPIDFSANKLFKAKIYSPRVGAKVLLKVENQTDGGISYQKEVATTVANTWEELSFDYSGIDVTKTYQKVVFIFDNGTVGDGSTNFTFLVDDVKLLPSTTPPPADPTTAATPPTRAAANVLSIYSNSYTNIDGVNLNPGWGQATVQSEVQLAGNSTLKLANLNYQGIELATTQNVSSYTGVHIDYWTSTSTDFNFYLISINPTVDTKKYTFAITKGAWQSVDIPLTTYAGVDLTKLAQMKFDGNGTIYMDNIYFYKESTTPTSPTLPLDFESTTIPYTFTDFGGGVMSVIANPNSGGINTSAKVAKMVKNAPEVYGGSYISLAAPIDFSANKLFKAKIYSPRVGAKVLLKVENQTEAGISYQKEVATTVANAWEELSFDYSGIDVTKAYQKVVFIFDNGTVGDGSANFTFLVDDVKLVPSTTPPPAEPTTAAPAPTRVAANVLSLYSNAYTNIDGVNLNPGWGQATVQSEVQLAGNSTLKLANLNYQGIELATTQNVSSYVGVHIDYWTSTSTEFNFYLISINPTVDTKKYTFAITKGAWQSVDIPLTTYAGVDLAKLAQMKFDGNGTIYIDNIYFYKTAKQDQTITFPAIADKVLGGAAFTVSATATSGLAVTYTTTSDKVTISGNTVTIAKAGSVTIKANQTGNDSFNAAAEVTQTFCIKPTKPTITSSGVNTAATILTSSSTTGNQWYLNGSAITGATNATYTIAAAGAYKVQVTIDGCSSDFSSESSFIVTGDIAAQSNTITIYPNPVETNLQIKGLSGESMNLNVFDITGRSSSILLEKVGDYHQANVQHLQQGFYVLAVQEGNQQIKLKFIKK